MTTTALDVRTLLPDGVNLIGGELVPAKSGQVIEIMDPSTQEVIARVARGDKEDVDAAVAAAAVAFPAWRRMNPTQRGQLIRQWGNLCGQHAEDLATLESMEVGHPLRKTMGVFNRMPHLVSYNADMADKILGHTLPASNPDFVGMTFHEPYGVCGIIVPWNSPGVLMMRDLTPAIAAGNTAVVKPAEDAPLTCMYMVKLSLEAGIPPGVVNVVNGYGAEAGEALASHPGVRHMSFTGSPETGSRVMEACAKNLTPLQLELGGKSPQIVFSDANLGKAVPAIVNALISNSGQVCYAGTRLLVEEPLRESLVDAVAGSFKEVRVGMWHEDVDIGPLINAKQEQRVLSYLESGLEQGAHAVVGGHKMTGSKYAKGFFVEPTVFDHVEPSMRIAQEEIFGPVLSVLSFKDPDEAIAIANGTPYGLVASVWTDSLHRAFSLAKEIEAGQVLINNYMAGSGYGAPFGGYKRSGFGRAGGTEALLSYTHTKSVIINAGK